MHGMQDEHEVIIIIAIECIGTSCTPLSLERLNSSFEKELMVAFHFVPWDWMEKF